MSPTAYINTNKLIDDAVAAGMQKLGYKTEVRTTPKNPMQGDVFCAWTLWDKCKRRRVADIAEKQGVKTLCFERAWLRGKGHWQVAWRLGQGVGFNGHGLHYAGGPERWAGMGLELKPWRKDGRHILVCGNKGSLYQGKISAAINHDDAWANDIVNRIIKQTNRPIHYRPHPGGAKLPCVPRVPVSRIIDTNHESLDESLAGAWCVVVYASSVASTAIINGIPVIYDGPRIMLSALASGSLLDIESPPMPGRLPELERCAWAQWSIDELASGMAFKQLRVPSFT
jgi:hypothetical protein